ncbi:MAG: hypothetical protein QG597_2255, partial [Actinomycetota bacterium]|nr:hypothetical protein [Actinomycetota bacterium]
FRNVRRRLPKLYARAPNGSGRSETLGDRDKHSSRIVINVNRVWGVWRLVDAAHPVDRHILDQRLNAELLHRHVLVHPGLLGIRHLAIRAQ